jgi:hypothetical protein
VHWQQSGSIAHVTLVGDNWAGVTYYATEVSYLIQESVLHLPGVTKLIFDKQLGGVTRGLHSNAGRKAP